MSRTSGCGCGSGQTAIGTTSATTSAGCSCGGGCSARGGCGCGGTGVQGASALVRPRFFGGMLLTEDDLQAIDDYTVAKRRLTNRHMFGAGVVCGLEVDCDPCKPGWLTVTPGYALDCCGNDIVVGCPVQIDALALLSDLRKREGLDCGEPCDDSSDRRYVLVVSYDEQPADPVAPYAQDDCAVGDCDFSRVREGYRFDLACEVRPPEPSLFDRLRECAKVGDPKGQEAAALIRMSRLAQTQARVAAAEAAGEAPVPPAPTVAEFGAAAKEGIGSAVELLGRSTAVLSAAAAHDAKLGPSTGLSAARRRTISEHSRDLAAELLGSPELTELPEVERRRVTVVLEAAQAQEDLAHLSVGQRIWLAEGYEAADAARSFTDEAERVRAGIVRRLETSGRGNCKERDEVDRLSFQRLDAGSNDAVYRLGQSFWSIVVGCLCDLVNPPCPTCTETQVPLATVMIEDCEVVDVCGLTREWVLAPRTLNYWVPIVDVLRGLLLERCCGREYRPTTEREVETLRDAGSRALSMIRSPLDAPEFRALYDAMGAPPAAEPPATPVPAAPQAALADAEAVTALEKQLDELREQVRLLGGDRP